MMKRTLLLTLAAILGLVQATWALTLFGEGFDDNTSLTGWKRTSTSYITRYTGTPKMGDACLRLQGNYEAVFYLNTVMFKNVKFNFKLAKNALPAGTAIEAWYDCGKGYVKAASLAATAANNTFTAYSVAIPNGYISTKLKFKMTTTSTTAYGYVDDVSVTGDR